MAELTPRQTDPLKAEDSLPSVEPPSAGFIIKLFVVPAIIVAIIISVWTLFHWISFKGVDPHTLAETLERNTAQRWQAASALADLMRTPDSEVKKDEELAQRLVRILEEELDSKETEVDDKATQFRGFLCKTLGEFELPDVLPVLVRAASMRHDDAEGKIRIRRSAIEALAVWSGKQNKESLRGSKELMTCLIDSAGDAHWAIRSPSAVALGVIGGEEAEKKLVAMLKDQHANVRNNAAVRLAHLGNAATLPVLEEMLDPKPLQELEQGNDTLRRLDVGIKAADELLTHAKFSGKGEKVVAALQALSDNAELPQQIRLHAKDVFLRVSK